jgi:TRAP-type mannitol/chloroaromatic compound transport system permease small subunit
MPDAAPAPDGPAPGPSGIVLPTTRISRALDAVVDAIGRATSWIWTLLMLLIVYQVAQRYIFGLGSIALEEAQWHLYAIGFMLALSFAEVRERHVRIDVLAEHWPLRRRLWIELVGLTCFLLPFVVVIVIFAVPFVVRSWELNEISAAPGGLPYRFVLKSFIVTAFVLLAMAAFARLTRVWAALFPRPAPDGR